MKISKKKTKNRFSGLARFVLCLGLCAMLGTLGFVSVTHAAIDATTTVTEAGLGDEYSSITVQNTQYAVNLYHPAGGSSLKLTSNCPISATGTFNGEMTGLHITGVNASDTVTITNSATITVTNDSSYANAGALGAKLNSTTVEAEDLTIDGVSAGYTTHGVYLLSAGTLKVNNLTIKNVTSNSYARGFTMDAATSFSLENGQKLAIDCVEGIDKAWGLELFNGASADLKGDVYIRNIRSDNKAYAICADIFTMLSPTADNSLNLSGGTYKIEGDVASLRADDAAYSSSVKIALQNEASFLKGNLLTYDDSTYVNRGEIELTLSNGGTWYPNFGDGYSTGSTGTQLVSYANTTVNLNEGGVIDVAYTDWSWGTEGEPLTDYSLMPDVHYDGEGAFHELEMAKLKADGGTFRIKTDLANNKGDVINLMNLVDNSGTANVQVAYDPTAAKGQTVNGAHLFLRMGQSVYHITITAKPYVYDKNGKTITFTPTVASDVDENGLEVWKITSVAGDIKEEDGEMVKAVSDTSNAINMAWMSNVSNLQKRLGDLRGGAISNTGWARFQRSMNDLNNGRKLNVSGNLYQIGYDFALKSDDASRGYFGLSLERFDGNQSFKIGSGDLKSTSLGVYYTKIYESGHYFDFIFRYGRYESDTTSCDTSLTDPKLTKLDYAENAVTFSGEYGYRWNFGKSGLYLEPQAEFIYGYLSGAKKTSSDGVLADIDSKNHFVTRWGVAMGQRVKNFNYYARASYYHDFAGSTNVTYGEASYKQDSAQNWWEVSVGGGWHLSDKSYFYAELTKHFKDVSNSINFNLGFRFIL